VSDSIIAVESSFFAAAFGAHTFAFRFTFSTLLVIHARIGLSTSRLFFSTIIMWPFPWMPSVTRRNSSALQPACLKYATPPGLPGDANDASAVTMTMGMFCRFFSLRAGSSCS